ncbi:Transcriptional regulator SlyA [Aquimixticola soesokkakensis]|uniref:Transcriptional regulator SlyA n=1 Tax=Aquimixticola soesokkakensis TaxID=1519096 RepID=A0A1Y5RWV6_9RHOB|nr:MarR family transcriptional regulator [Aquimixticola soesokkakensis]SLN26006.1 Transcriptional regulator SlyA [Aquimixticola soesokkakensis]
MSARKAASDAAPGTISDTVLRQFVGYNMKRAYINVSADMSATLEPFGLKIMTFSALAIVLENPDLTQTQLGGALGIERSGVVVLVDELEEADLIARNRVAGNRRSYALRATVKGQALWKKVEARVRLHEARLLANLTDDDKESLRAMLHGLGSTEGSSDEK